MIKYWKPFIIVIGLLVCLLPIILYYLQFGANGLAKDSLHWGIFGNYIGGILGTIFSLFSVALIYVTYKNQVYSSTIQQFEMTFFTLLQNQREILKSLYGYIEPNIPNKQTYYKAEGYISEIAELLNGKFGYLGASLLDFETKTSVENFESSKKENMEKTIQIYESVYEGKEAELGHYFRHLYHIVKYVDESRIRDKKKYIDIIQAQMNDDELYVTFFNGISEYGKNKFLPLLDKYSFLENIKSRGAFFNHVAKQFYPKTKFKH